MGQAALWVRPKNLLDRPREAHVWPADAQSTQSPGCGAGRALSAGQGGADPVRTEVFWDDSVR